jgi:hypothetical protein
MDRDPAAELGDRGDVPGGRGRDSLLGNALVSQRLIAPSEPAQHESVVPAQGSTFVLVLNQVILAAHLTTSPVPASDAGKKK